MDSRKRVTQPARPLAVRRQGRSLGVLVGATRLVTQEGEEQGFSLDLLDLDAGDTVPSRIRLPFPGHGFALRPRGRGEAAVFEKRGCGGCIVDLVAQRIVRPIEPTAGHAFYGHGAYSRTGDVLFVVETQLDNLQGAVSVRDAVTFGVLGRLSTYGIAPHDCHLVENGQTLVVTNGGGPAGSAKLPSVNFIDVASGTLLESHEFRSCKINAGHVALLAGREFAAVSAPLAGLPLRSPGGVTLRRCGEKAVTIDAPKAVTSRLVGEALSVVIHPGLRVAVVTHPEANRLTFWSLDAGVLEATLELPQPRGVTITLDGRFFAVAYGTHGRVLLVEVRQRCAMTGRRLAIGVLGGAHLYTWAG